MSKIIRHVKQRWTPMPGMSLDPRVHIPPDVYRFTQNQIESQQRQQQSQVNATIRAGKQKIPSVGSGVRPVALDQGVIPVLPLGTRR